MKFQFKNFHNAFCSIKWDEQNFIFDPWIKSGIWDGGWAPYPPLKNELASYVESATYCFPSHIHEDHFDPLAFELMSKSTQMFVPEVYAHHIMSSRLNEMGFKNMKKLPQSESIKIEDNISLHVIPPMNSQGLEFDSENIPITDLAIDTGIIFDTGETKIVLLADNTPYNPEQAGKSLEQIKDCDILAFNYNGAAGEYPLCYKMPEEKRAEIRNENENKREKAILEFIDIVKPKLLLPYSSEFSVMGPMAKKFAKFHGDGQWMDKKEVAERYGKKSGIESIYLYEDDHINIENGHLKIEINTKKIPTIYEMSEKYYNPITSIKSKYNKPNIIDLERDLHYAVNNAFNKSKQLNLIPNTKLVVILTDFDDKIFVIDIKNKQISNQCQVEDRFVKCYIPGNYLHAILKRQTSWNSAILSFQIEWERNSDEYDKDFHLTLNFLTLHKSDQVWKRENNQSRTA